MISNSSQSNQFYSLTISSLFSRFIVAFGAGFIGLLILYVILLATWGVVGEVLSPPADISNDLGIRISETQTHPLFLVVILLAVFLSTLSANISYTFLASLVQEEFTRRSTSLTHVFFGNVLFLVFMIPVYFVMNLHFGTVGIFVSAVLHTVVTAFFTFFVLQALHQSKYLVVNLYGNLFGFLIFAFLVSILAKTDRIVALFLTFPFFYGLLAFGNRFMELVYAWVYKSYGTDFLNVDTHFGEDYGEKISREAEKKDFDI